MTPDLPASVLLVVVGLVRDQLTTAVFGASVIGSAFILAFQFPNLFRRLFAEGAFSQAFVPLIAATREREGDEADQADEGDGAMHGGHLQGRAGAHASQPGAS